MWNIRLAICARTLIESGHTTHDPVDGPVYPQLDKPINRRGLRMYTCCVVFRSLCARNGILARGGSMDGSGAVVVWPHVYVNCGYGGLIGSPGNVLLACGLD